MNKQSFLQKKFNTGFVNNTTGTTLNLKACFPNKDLKPKIYGSTIQSNLPVEYQEVEYIESTGTQYIDSGYAININCSAKYKFEIIGTVSNGHPIAGVFNSSQSDLYFGIVRSADSKLNYRYLNEFYPSNTTIIKNTIYETEVSLNKSNQSLKINGVIENTSNDSSVFTNNLTCHIFRINNLPLTGIIGRIYYFKIYDNNILVRNFIPCYRKSDNVIGLYDTVNGIFYTNAGTGTFLKGNDVVPTPDNPVEIQSLGDKTDNLIDYTTVQPTSNTSITLINNGFKVVGKYAGKIVVEGLKPNTDYFLSYIRENIIGNTQSVVIFSDTTTTTQITTLVKPGVFNTGNNTTINIWFYTSIGGDNNESNFTNIQLKEGILETDYEPYGYKIPVKIRGKNKINFVYSEQGAINSAGIEEANSSNWRTTIFIPVKPNTSYSLSSSSNLNTLRLYQYDKNKNFISPRSEKSETNNLTIVTGSNTYYLKWTIFKNGTTLTKEIVESYNLQLEEGSIATEYEPYHEPITVPIYLDAPLRRARDGSVADYIDFGNQKDKRSMKRIVLNGDEQGWTITEPYGHKGFVAPVTGLKLISSSTNIANLMSNYYNVYSSNQLFNYNSDKFGLCARTNSSELIFRNDDCADLNEFKEWLSTHPVEVVYELATPTEEDIELPELLTEYGTNIIELDTLIQPSSMECSYRSKIKL